MARLHLVRLAVEFHAASGPSKNRDVSESQSGIKQQKESPGEAGFAEAQRLIDQTTAALPAPSALDRISEAFSLSPFERDLLLLCAGTELDGSFASLCGNAQGDARLNFATLSLALAA